MLTDSIGDFFTRIRNAARAGQETVSVPHSKLKEQIAELLKKEGFVTSFEVEERSPKKKWLSLALKYQQNGEAVLENIRRISKPGHRVYGGAPKNAMVRNGVGFQIFSTSRGILTDKMAVEAKVGGEILGEVW